MRTLHIGILLSFFTMLLLAQQSGPSFRRTGILDANRVKTVFKNTGVIGQPATSSNRGAWIYSNNGYIGDLSFMVGVEIPEQAQSIHSVITCSMERPTAIADANPSTGKAWTFEPLDGYSNPNNPSIAISSDKSTWPSVWPDHPEMQAPGGGVLWNGVFGPGTPQGRTEVYFAVNDNNDERFNYSEYNTFGLSFKPDSTNLLRNGMGLRVDVRYVELPSLMGRDAMFAVYDITNQSTHNYSKVVFGQLCGTYVGVTSTEDYSEYNDDASVLFKGENIVITSDYGNTITNPLWTGPAGRVGHAFVQAPGVNHIASYQSFAPANQIKLGSDEDLWSKLTPGSFSTGPCHIDTLTTCGSDEDYIFGSEFFSLKSKETKRIVVALAYGYSDAQVVQQVRIARAFWSAGFDAAQLASAAAITNFTTPSTISGNRSISWTATTSTKYIDLYHSPDAGRTWQFLTKREASAGSYLWNTATVADCAFGKLRLVAYDSTDQPIGVFETGPLYQVKNGGEPPIALQLQQLEIKTNGTISEDSAAVTLLLGGPTTPNVPVTGYYSLDGKTWIAYETRLLSPSLSPIMFRTNLRVIPNSERLMLKFSATLDNVISSDTSVLFRKWNEPRKASSSSIVHTRGSSTSLCEIHIADQAQVTGDSYIISFDDTSSLASTYYNIYNKSKGVYTRQHALLGEKEQSPSFDGLMFYVTNVRTSVDASSGLRWSRSAPESTQVAIAQTKWEFMAFPNYKSYRGYALPHDYAVAFGDAVLDTTLAIPEFYMSATPIKMRVTNKTTGKRVRIVTGGFDAPWGEVALIEPESRGQKNLTWDLLFSTPERWTSFPMHTGDTLFITTQKGLTYLDTLVVNSSLIISAVSENRPLTAALEQNYPNPFNPSTTIRFTLPVAAHARLSVFDLLGREIALLVDGICTPGVTTARFDARNFASGVYFYRLELPGFSETKKLLLLK